MTRKGRDSQLDITDIKVRERERVPIHMELTSSGMTSSFSSVWQSGLSGY